MSCLICGGVGWVSSGVTIITDPMFGQAVSCECKKKETWNYLAKQSNVSNWERQWTLDSFPGDQAAKHAAMEAVETKRGIWVFVSDFGRGKSGLLIGIINALVSQGYPALYKTVPYMLDELRNGFRDDSYFERLQGLIEVPVLALDEFHRAHEKTQGDALHGSASWVAEKLFTLIDERYSHWDDRMTLIATNRGFDQGDLDPIASRLSDPMRCRVVHVMGEDLRPSAAMLANVSAMQTEETH